MQGRDPWAIGLGLFGVVNLANGLWMLLDASGWYTGIPAEVPDFGPLNVHFVRDVGAAYVTLGAGCLWATARPAGRFAVLLLTSVFYVLHALGHVWDTAGGVVGPEHWLLDFPTIYLPAALLPFFTWRLRAKGV